MPEQLISDRSNWKCIHCGQPFGIEGGRFGGGKWLPNGDHEHGIHTHPALPPPSEIKQMQVMDISKAKACPFCPEGDSGLKIITIMLDETIPFIAKAVFCNNCHCTGPHAARSGWAESDQEAIELWNDRAIPEPSRKLDEDKRLIQKIYGQVISDPKRALKYPELVREMADILGQKPQKPEDI